MKNQPYSLEFGYLLNNWTDLVSFWTKWTGEAYLEWSKTFGKRLSVKSPQKTQGQLEVHQKLTKRLFFWVNEKNWYCHPGVEIKKSFITPISQSRKKQVPCKDKVISKNLWQTTKQKKRTYQEKFNVNRFQKISKNKVAAGTPTSTSETDQTS